jgi:hypothetical protein
MVIPENTSNFRRKFSAIIFSVCLGFNLLNTANLLAQSVDTVRVRANEVLILPDTIYIPQQDTLFLLADTLKYKVKDNPYYRSDTFYDSLRAKTYRNFVTRELYKLLIRPPAQDVYESDKVVRSEQYFIPYNGKTIRKIRVSHVALLDGNVQDTTQKATTHLGRIMSFMHTSTRSSLVLQNMLFKEGDRVDAYLVADSERILRELAFIEDARIHFLNDPEKEDEVSATVVIKDRLPWNFNISFDSFSKYKVRLGNRSILGTGNQLWAEYLRNSDEIPNNGYNFLFESRYLGNSFTRITLEWADNWQVQKKVVRITKDFVSPKIKYGGEISIGEEARKVEPVFLDSTLEYDIHYQFQDIWAGRAFALSGSSHRKTLMVGLRYLHHDFLERPEVKIDSNVRYQNRQLWLSSLSLQKINYMKTRYILAYGITEDVPVGYTYGLLYGKDYTEFETRDYWGGQIRLAHYFPALGYFLFTGHAGTFWNGDEFKDSILKFRLGYFTPLLRMGKTNVRNFVQLYYNIGKNLSPPETFNIENFIRDLSGNHTHGNTIFSAQFESVCFLPWYIYGFRLASFFSLDVGQVQENRNQVHIQDFITGIGGGVRIRNESLVFRTLELGVKYFPVTLPESSHWSVDVSFTLPILFEGLTSFKPEIISLD